MPPIDRQLLIGAHKGSGPAAEALWARLSPRMTAYARALVRDPHAAADVVQSVFLQMLRQPRRRIRRVRDVPAWMLLLTRNAAINHLRSQRRDVARLHSLGPEQASPHEPSDTLPACLAELPRRDREILVLKHVVGLTFDQIALALDMNRNTAAARHRVAMARLRTVLDPEATEAVGRCTP